MKLGLQKFTPSSKDFLFSKYRTSGGLPKQPATDSISSLKLPADLGILGNDKYGDCVARGQRILMGDGTTKSIENIKVLDEVLTEKGNIRKVLGVKSKE